MASSSRRNTFKNRLLVALPVEEIEQFGTGQTVSLSLRQVLYEVGAPLCHVYFLEDGVASVLTTMEDGSTIEVGMIGAEGMVGVTSLLGATVSAQHIVVQVPGSAWRVNAADCREAFAQSAAVRRVVNPFVIGLLNLSAQTAACNRLHSIDRAAGRPMASYGQRSVRVERDPADP